MTFYTYSPTLLPSWLLSPKIIWESISEYSIDQAIESCTSHDQTNCGLHFCKPNKFPHSRYCGEQLVQRNARLLITILFLCSVVDYTWRSQDHPLRFITTTGYFVVLQFCRRLSLLPFKTNLVKALTYSTMISSPLIPSIAPSCFSASLPSFSLKA